MFSTLNNAMLESIHRYDREFWIGSGLPKVKNYGTEQADNNDFYGNEFPSCAYINH